MPIVHDITQHTIPVVLAILVLFAIVGFVVGIVWNFYSIRSKIRRCLQEVRNMKEEIEELRKQTAVLQSLVDAIKASNEKVEIVRLGQVELAKELHLFINSCIEGGVFSKPKE